MGPIDHVAILVRSLEGALARLGPIEGLGEIAEFPGEGTREVYVGEEGRPARLLLMEPLGETGPYARAMRKRGPGVRHLAYRVGTFDAFLDETPGWLLHPVSLKTVSHSVLWLARPGVPFLLEVSAGAEAYIGSAVVTDVSIPTPEALTKLTSPLGIRVGDASFVINGRRIEVADLVGG